jgi:hypothetical protein
LLAIPDSGGQQERNRLQHKQAETANAIYDLSPSQEMGVTLNTDPTGLDVNQNIEFSAR